LTWLNRSLYRSLYWFSEDLPRASAKGSAARIAGSHLEWEFARNAIESLACDGHPKRWPLSFWGPALSVNAAPLIRRPEQGGKAYLAGFCEPMTQVVEAIRRLNIELSASSPAILTVLPPNSLTSAGRNLRDRSYRSFDSTRRSTPSSQISSTGISNGALSSRLNECVKQWQVKSTTTSTSKRDRGRREVRRHPDVLVPLFAAKYDPWKSVPRLDCIGMLKYDRRI